MMTKLEALERYGIFGLDEYGKEKWWYTKLLNIEGFDTMVPDDLIHQIHKEVGHLPKPL